MNKEFFEALAMLEKEKGIPMQYLIEKIEAAISIAIKRDENGAEDNVVEINPETGRFYVAVRKTVVEEIEDPAMRSSRPRLPSTTRLPLWATSLRSRWRPRTSDASRPRLPSM